ncbi:hypothetical protein BSKO_07003 [Bryopsis sp. KO-2023]|nr:hypothetical protein BSKO_07003 [Bryopsis sp. KO-2023]
MGNNFLGIRTSCFVNQKSSLIRSIGEAGRFEGLFLVVVILGLATEARSQSRIHQGSVEVENCRQLREYLGQKNGPTNIVVGGSFRCNREEWGPAVVVARNVTVRGSREDFPAIDWSDTSKVVVAGKFTRITFQRLVFVQDEMGISGINLGFFASQQNSLGEFSGIVVGVRSCPDPINSFSGVVNDLRRPEWLGGSQRVTVQGQNTLLVNDVGISWRSTGAVWRLCSIVFECGITTLKDPSLVDLFSVAEVQDDQVCPDSVDDEVRDEFVGKPSTVLPDSTLIIIVCAAFGAALLALVITVAFLWRHKRGKAKEQAEELKDLGLQVTTEERPLAGVSSSAFRSWNIHLSDVDVGTPLGRGGFGKVYKGSWQGTTVAVKIIRHNDKLLQTRSGEPFEAFLSKHISHPNVVQTYHISTREADEACSPTNFFEATVGGPVGASDEDSTSTELFASFDREEPSFEVESPGGEGSGPSNYETWIVLEYCERGSLKTMIANEAFGVRGASHTRKMSHILRTALEIASAMNYLHSVRIIHGDLKPGNVLLKSDGSDPRGFTCKVGDFGLSRFLALESHIETFTCGTATHMPPELLKGGVLSPAADVYSFGILLWELITGEAPYADKNQGEIILGVVNNQDRPIVSSAIPKEYAGLIRECWQQDHLDRPGFPEIMDRLRGLLHDAEKQGSGRRLLPLSRVLSARGAAGVGSNAGGPPALVMQSEVVFPSEAERMREMGQLREVRGEITSEREQIDRGSTSSKVEHALETRIQVSNTTKHTNALAAGRPKFNFSPSSSPRRRPLPVSHDFLPPRKALNNKTLVGSSSRGLRNVDWLRPAVSEDFNYRVAPEVPAFLSGESIFFSGSEDHLRRVEGRSQIRITSKGNSNGSNHPSSSR